MLKGKKILLGITGSIAAYKAAYLVRFLIKEGADVQVLVTPEAKNFITPLTFSALSTHPVLSEPFDKVTGAWESHVELGRWGDVFLIAPASANTLSKMATGITDNLLTATYLAAKCPVIIAPAMDLDMYKHPATQNNIAILKSFGHQIIEPQSGELASGLVGCGRMEEPENIVHFIKNFFSKQLSLNGVKALITAGPTYESIDPVRFIGNYSSGKMGFALAEVLAQRGAQVRLITGPTACSTIHPNIDRINVVSADEMYEQCQLYFNESTIAIMSAAVADYKIVNSSDLKLKRNNNKNITLDLIPNTDIAQSLGKQKKQNQLFIGFALETDNEHINAKEKLKKKNFDFIVLNSLKDEGAGFGHDTNKITIFDKDENHIQYELKQKNDVANDIIDYAQNLLSKN